MSWYGTFVIEEKFGFNKNTPAQFIKDEIIAVVRSAAPAIVKVIIETCLLTKEEKITAANSENNSTITRSVSTISNWDSKGAKTIKTKVILFVHLETPNVSQISIVENIPKNIARKIHNVKKRSRKESFFISDFILVYFVLYRNVT